jgi:uncharacterized protein YlxP (DUF503 family)
MTLGALPIFYPQEERMTVFGAILSAILRKAQAFLNECRALVASAKTVEKRIVVAAENDVRDVLASAEFSIARIKGKSSSEVKNLRENLVASIAKL